MLLADDQVSVFFDGTVHDPQLDHPEGVAVHPDGSVWCGGERGQIFRLDPDGGSIEEVGSTGGFALGMAFDRTAEQLFICDLKQAAVFRLETASGRVQRFTDGSPAGPFKIPNYPAFDVEGNLYVGCYEPSQVLRIDPSGTVDVLWHDVTAHTLAHPTNLAFRGTTMFTSNLGRWHLTRIEVGIEGLRLPVGSGA